MNHVFANIMTSYTLNIQDIASVVIFAPEYSLPRYSNYHTIATRNIDILSASYRAKMLHKARIS